MNTKAPTLRATKPRMMYFSLILVGLGSRRVLRVVVGADAGDSQQRDDDGDLRAGRHQAAADAGTAYQGTKLSCFAGTMRWRESVFWRSVMLLVPSRADAMPEAITWLCQSAILSGEKLRTWRPK